MELIPKEITVNISKKLGRANFSSDMASASITFTIEDEAEIKEAFVKGWAICHEEVEKQEEALKGQADIKESIDASLNFEQDINQEPKVPFCPIHKINMVWKPAGVSQKTGKAYAGFYSCPGRNPDGSFCNQRPQ